MNTAEITGWGQPVSRETGAPITSTWHAYVIDEALGEDAPALCGERHPAVWGLIPFDAVPDRDRCFYCAGVVERRAAAGA
jgi:hypothetical protein